MVLILGLETSCDETAAALYDSELGLLSHSVHSQIDLHCLYGGVVPELASRDHIKRITPLIKQCLTTAGKNKYDIDAVSYTAGPGLNGALLVGASVANSLAFSLNIPAIAVHHLEGHILSPLLSQTKLDTPFITLLVSGGHTQLIMVNHIGNYTILGDTLDDAAGEAFDKCAKLLGLPYPGGKYIAQLASAGSPVYNLPSPMLYSNDLNFSFSGLKTATAILINKIKQHQFNLEIKQNIAATIEESITNVLVHKAAKAVVETKVNRLVICGGVSSNQTLRRKLDSLKNVDIFYPPLEFCTDNAAMIALAGYTRLQQQHNKQNNYAFNVHPRWDLTTLNIN